MKARSIATATMLALMTTTALAQPVRRRLVTKQYRVKDVSGAYDLYVTITASGLVDARLLDYLSKQLRVRVLPRPAGQEYTALRDNAARINPNAGELTISLAAGGAKVDPRRITWLWPDGFELARPGVLRVKPELAAGLAKDRGFRFGTGIKDDGGSGGGPLPGRPGTLRGKLTCTVAGSADADLRFVNVQAGGGQDQTDTNGQFEINGTFAPGPLTLAIIYDASVSSGLTSGATPFRVMDEIQDAGREPGIAVAVPTASDPSVLDVGTVNLTSLDCELWRLGVIILEDYHSRANRPPPAQNLRIKRWNTFDFVLPFAYYDYIVVPKTFINGVYVDAWQRHSTLLHEFGHTVRHRADGDEAHWNWDDFRWAYVRSHSGCDIYNVQVAFNEGWAEYWSNQNAFACPLPASDNLDWNEGLIARYLGELSNLVTPATMVKVLEDNPGSIHSIRDFEEKYCNAVLWSWPNKYCTVYKTPTRAKPPSCPPDYVDDGATCRRPDVKAKSSYPRDVGVTPTDCGTKELDAGLCYSLCPSGYRGVGPICWQNCPAGFHDDGAFCGKPSPRGRGAGYPMEVSIYAKNSYGNGNGYSWDFSGNGYDRCIRDHPSGCVEGSPTIWYEKCRDGYDAAGFMCWERCRPGYYNDGLTCRGDGLALARDKCNRENPQGCEQYGALYYPKCQAGFHAVGCCVCSPNCVDDMNDIGVSCAKKSRARDAGTVPTSCQPGMQYDAGLCYQPCRAGFNGVGPVCWGSCDPGFADHGATCYRESNIIVKY